MDMLRVLVVDDEEIICESIKADFARMEHPWEYVVFTANSVTEAEEVFTHEHPQILITDISMPGGSGLLLVDNVRKKSSDCGILVLSAYDNYDYVRNAFTLGANDYILKPIAFSELQRQVYKLAENMQKSENLEMVKLAAIESTIYGIEEILAYVHEHIAEKLSALELAKKMAVSYNAFGRIFKEHTKMAFSAYVLWYRMELAKEYLQNSSIQIKQVAAKVGYKENPQHFSRDFTKYAGISPKEYREKK
ncbi:MAG: response regulator [Lachnospiraceae bacterium]|nr:response regulator [Lachnospiraceae bacterium]